MQFSPSAVFWVNTLYLSFHDSLSVTIGHKVLLRVFLLTAFPLRFYLLPYYPPNCVNQNWFEVKGKTFATDQQFSLSQSSAMYVCPAKIVRQEICVRWNIDIHTKEEFIRVDCEQNLSQRGFLWWFCWWAYSVRHKPALLDLELTDMKAIWRPVCEGFFHSSFSQLSQFTGIIKPVRDHGESRW